MEGNTHPCADEGKRKVIKDKMLAKTNEHLLISEIDDINVPKDIFQCPISPSSDEAHFKKKGNADH